MHLWHARPSHRRRVNGQRRSFIAVIALVASGLSIGFFNPFAATAAPQAFGMSMVPDSGRFKIANNEPGAPLGEPTNVSGTFDPATGEFTDVAFATPSVHIVQQVTDPLPATVIIDQQLIPLAPGNGTINSNGDMTLNLSFKLHVIINAANIAKGDCWSQPINVVLESTAPYDPTTGLVTLKDEGFNIPNLETTNECKEIITNNAGKQFAGTNNRLELTLQGDLNAALAESATELAVTPASPTTLGTNTVMAATVTPAEASGQVDFYSGATLLGSSQTNAEGVASFTKKLDAGKHDLSAKYVGNSTHAASTSEIAEDYTVIAPVNFGAEFPAVLTPGAAAKEFTLTVNNPSSGVTSNVRIDFAISQLPQDTAVDGSNVTPSQLSFEYQNGEGEWLPIELSQTGQTYNTMTGAYGTLTGFELEPGQKREVPLRMAVAVGTPKRTLNVSSTLRGVNPVNGNTTATYGSFTSSVIVPPASRVDVGAINLAFVGTSTVYRGQTFALSGNVVAATNVAGQPVNPRPAGAAEVLLDGEPVPAVDFLSNTPPGGAQIPMVALGTPANSGGFTREFVETAHLSPGQHTVQLHYLGDTNYRDAFSTTLTITVLPAHGTLYDCTYTQLATGINHHWRMLVSGFATLPGAVTSGSTVNISDGEVRVGMAPVVGSGNQGLFSPVRNLAAALSPNGVLTKAAPAAAIFAAANPATNQFDTRATWSGLNAAVTVEGDPGDVVDIAMPALTFNHTSLNQPVSCEPRSGTAKIGKVTIAGTELKVTPTGIANIGQNVTLTAEVKPATGGSIEFFDGESSIGLVPVTAGKAVLTTANLGGGIHQLKARHSGGSITVNGSSLSVAPNESNVVEQAVQYSTTTTVTSSSASVAQGPVTLTAKVATVPANAAVPTGSVQFKANGNPIGSPVSLTNGQAQLTTAAFQAGANAVTATYAGSTDFAASTSAPTTVTVGKIVTSIAVAPAAGKVSGAYWKVPGMKATLTSPAGPVVGKLVTFKIGQNTACAALTDASGVAACAGQVPSLAVLFKNSYTATFAGDSTATAVTGTGAMTAG